MTHAAPLRATIGVTPMKRILLVLAAGVSALFLASCSHKPPANVAAEVNGHAITLAELDKTYQSNAQQAEGASEDQIMAQKIDLLSSMIIQEIMLQRAENWAWRQSMPTWMAKSPKCARP